jgi:Pentapeptide repeats (8 copies)
VSDVAVLFKRGVEMIIKDLSGVVIVDLPLNSLQEANLRGANLQEANLRGADLRGADLYNANLRGADLYNANLRGADLQEANLRGADLRGADLRGADLRGADLHGVDLHGVDLHGAIVHSDVTLIGSDSILFLGPIGSRFDILFCFKTTKGLYFRTGCFIGDETKFENAIKAHKLTTYQKNYLAALAFARVWGKDV